MRSMVVEAYSERRFSLANILFLADGALEHVYDVRAIAIKGAANLKGEV